MPAEAGKASLRAIVLAQRAGVPHPIREKMAQRLAEVGPSLALRHAKPPGAIVAAFLPIRGEAETSLLIEALGLQGYDTALPVAKARGVPLRFRRWSPGDPLEAGALNVQEPLTLATQVDPDVLFVPLAAFDRIGNRLGYGAGFYDQALAGLRRRKPVLAIGIAFAVQEVRAIPVEPHDERLDIVITESETIYCRRS